MKKDKFRKECGSVEVEATIILPIAILSVILLLYLSLFMFQRANLQACLETTLVYYKNTATDSYVVQNIDPDMAGVIKNAGVEGGGDSHLKMAAGNSYQTPDTVLFPYRGGLIDVFGSAFGGDGMYDLGNQEKFEEYFDSVAGNMLFDDTLELEIDYSNYVIYKQLEVKATQTVKAPINFSILGIGNEYEISATAMVNVIDHESMIRNVDYAVQLIDDTVVGQYVRNFASKFKELYQKMKDALGIEE